MEIELVLSELDMAGYWIQKILQPSYDTLVLELFGSGGKKSILISVASGACRIHGLHSMPAKNERPLRFMECLKSRIKGGRIESVRQLALDRIIKFEITAPAEQEEARYTLYARLWSGAGNILLADQAGIIIDAMLRKPERGEVSGTACAIEAGLKPLDAETSAEKAAKFLVRELPGEGDFSSRVETHYGVHSGELSLDNLLKLAREKYEKRKNFLESRAQELQVRLEEFKTQDRMKQIGDILLAGGFEWPEKLSRTPRPGFVQTRDFYEDKDISVQVDFALTPAENATRYYEKARKAASGREDVQIELEKAHDALKKLDEWLASMEAQTDPFVIAKDLERAGTVREKAIRKYPCIFIERKEWTILVGRSAKENDELLRHIVKGSDLWFHARDYAGSYVFIKARKGKTFPLDLMLEAAQLALYYSKARKNVDGDVYYTHAKYLRRIKGGPLGLVSPTLEKNLHVRINPDQLKEILGGNLEAEQ
jgi:predicted ribosome quality control (RQC) complex YloA/Tae2 family protein